MAFADQIDENPDLSLVLCGDVDRQGLAEAVLSEENHV